MHIRPPLQEDLPALLALDQACFPPEIAYSRAELRHFLWHPSSFSIAAEHEGTLTGFAVARSVRSQVTLLGEVVPSLHIITIDVAPDSRRSGVGTCLMEWLSAQAEAVGARAIILEAAVNNLGAHRFYAQHGFQPTGTIAGYYNATLDAFTFEKLMGQAHRGCSRL